MAKLLSKETLHKIRQLRERGYSIGEIKAETGVGYGTVWRYIENITILPEFRSRLLERKKSSSYRKSKALDQARIKAEKVVKSLSDKEKALFLAAIYWGEGSKKDFGLSNTDPRLISIFVKGLTSIFEVKKEDLRVSIRIYEDLDKDECLEFWSTITNVPVDKFIGVNILKGKKVGKLKYGMCRIRVSKGGNLLKYISALKEEVVNYF